MPSTRIKYLRIFLAITLCVFGASQSAFATTCAANESPTANCTNLEINGSNLTITNPSGVIVEGGLGAGIVDYGSNNSIVNHGEVRGYATPTPGSMAVTIYGSLSTLTNTGAIGKQANTGVSLLAAGSGASITSLSNAGSIASGSHFFGEAIFLDNTSRIFSFTNSGYVGSFDGGHTAISSSGVLNSGTITLLNNTSAGVMMGINSTIDNGSTGTITTLTNSGKIGTGNGTTANTQFGVSNFGTITNLNNTVSGVIMGSLSALSNSSGASIGTLTNSGTLSSTGYRAIHNFGTIETLTNNGTISSGANTIENASGATITTLTNSGTVASLNDFGVAVANDGLISTLTNSGTITVGGAGDGISNAGTINNVLNTGIISGGINSHSIINVGHIRIINNANTLGESISNQSGTIDTLINSGSISSGSNGIENTNGGTIGTITNTGSIYSTDLGRASILNDPALATSIATLNNAQGAGNAHGALTYSGALPSNYNIIFNSPTNYGKLDASAFSVTGTTNFGIYSGSLLSKGTYTAVLSGLTSSNVSTATRSGMYNGTAWSLVLASGSSTIWDLIVQSSATNTLASVQQNSNGLATVYNQQTAAYQAALSYDCQVYDQNNLCVSVGGRYTYAGPSPSSNQQAGLVILGYKPVQTFRVGAFADQSVNISTPTGFSQSKTSPMWGFFAKWHKNKDETGLGVQASVVTSSSSLTATRPQLFNTETGSGSTQFNGQGYQLTTNYHQPVTNNTSVVPYLGLRYTRINAGAYTENTTATVTSPLSYNAMAQNTFSAIAGLGVRSHLAEKLTGTASVGIQQNLNYSMGNYAGTSNITGLESFSVQMPGNVNSMATATAGMFYDINKRERVGLNVLWQQQPFIATNTTTALATYTIGF